MSLPHKYGPCDLESVQNCSLSRRGDRKFTFAPFAMRLPKCRHDRLRGLNRAISRPRTIGSILSKRQEKNPG